MKKILIYSAALLFGSLLVSCGDEKLNPNSVIVDPAGSDADFDSYLFREFVVPYNIEVKYWLDDKETDQEHVLVPARIESAKVMAVLLKHLWLDVYSEVSMDGINFTREYASHVVLLVGSGSWNSNGTVTLGEAAGGKKITLFAVNSLDPEVPESLAPSFLLRNKGYFQTIHHEFAHILHQTKVYPQNYKQISTSDYVGDLGWDDFTDQEALNLGFISPYSSKNADEDLVEIISMYITMTEAAWNARVASASVSGQAKLAEKLDIIKSYLSTSWGLDLNHLRDVVLRRASEVEQLEFVNLK
jgi:substrate import-associated zinc metallohydrolase lipoprotein